jgi:tRNA threonylcarbamoyladenosine biosynthesis protein TsaB
MGKGHSAVTLAPAPAMKLLIIDTSTTTCSVAVTDGPQILAESLVNLPGPSSSRLSDCIAQVVSLAGCQLTDLDGFGVTIGPGAFTGLRVGLATVKGLAMATGKPIAGISSLALLAANITGSALPVCPLFDARKGEVYAGLYQCLTEPVSLQPDCVISPSALVSTLTGEILFIGDGAVRYRSLIQEQLGARAHFAPARANAPRAATAATLVTDILSTNSGVTPAALKPVYLRLSEAEVSRLANQ